MVLKLPNAGRSSRLPGESRRGGAIVELAIVSFLLLLMLFGVIDFGRALLTRHAITSLSREAANLESRGTSLQATLRAAILTSGSIDLATHGYVILTAISRDDNGVHIDQQVSDGGVPFASKIGSLGSPVDPSHLPTGLPQLNQTLYAAEVFVNFEAKTPVGSLLAQALPTSLYDVAYF